MIEIFGAGMAGLIAGHFFRRESPIIYEIQPSLPNNHAALLRFRTDAVSRLTGIPFKKVLVRKAIHFDKRLYGHCNIALANAYSQKVTGTIDNRSIWDLEPAYRYIAPENFIEQLAEGLTIKYDTSFPPLESFINCDLNPIISTIPMPTLMEILSWADRPTFNYSTIWSLNAKIESLPCDIYCTIYFPEPHVSLYRASITGNRVILEFIRDPKIDRVEEYTAEFLFTIFGIDVINVSDVFWKKQLYGKLVSKGTEEKAQAFIMAMTDRHQIYSLGRFATWRQLLLDDMIKDCEVIHRLITTKGRYQQLTKGSQ